MALYVGNTRYKVMVGSQKHDFVVPLPYDAEVEWLQSDGNAYIDTGIKVAGNLSANVYLVDFFTSEFVGRSAFGGLDHIAEGDWDSDIRQFGFGINPDDKAVFYYDSSSIVFDDYSTYPQSARVVIENGVISVDSEQYTYIPASFTTLMSIILFGWHTGPIFNTPCKMGPCYLSDGTTTLDLIPVRKDGVGYMYDKISGKLFGREETGNFIIGPDKVLPYDAEVEYLESTGTQYIDTGIECTSDLKVQFEGLVTTTVNAAACGGINTASPYFRHHWSPSGNAFYWIQRDTAVQSSVTYTSSINTLYNITVDPANGTAIINGTSKTFTALPSTYTTGQSYYIFARKASDGGTQSRPVRFKFFKMWRNDVLLRDFIPVRVGQTGYIYDKVSGKLFGNSGTGSFIIGPDKNLPYDAEVEYIESTGTQYIDLGTPIDMSDTQIESSGYLLVDNKFFYMARVNASSYFWGVYALRADYGNSSHGQKSVSISVNTWHNITDTSTGFWLDGNKKIDRIAINARTSNNMLLFASALNGTITCGAFRCGFFKVTTNNNVVFDLIPVRKDGIGYMYDKVSGTLFGNAGTGNFILGNDVTT